MAETARSARNLYYDNVRKTQQAVFDVFAKFGSLSDEHMVDIYESNYRFQGWPRQSPSGLRTRRKELTRIGSLVDTGLRVSTSSGRSAIVWGVNTELSAGRRDDGTLF